MQKIVSASHYPKIFQFLCCGLGFLLVLSLQKYFLTTSYTSSALVGFIGSFIPQSRFYDFKKLIACVYTGAFAAMCALTYFTSLIDVFSLCLITGLCFVLFGRFFKGFGGKLGTLAFVSSLSFLFLRGSF